jgi:hypothetical protein
VIAIAEMAEAQVTSAEAMSPMLVRTPQRRLRR